LDIKAFRFGEAAMAGFVLKLTPDTGTARSVAAFLKQHSFLK
jgi:hypothetical protein